MLLTINTSNMANLKYFSIAIIIAFFAISITSGNPVHQAQKSCPQPSTQTLNQLLSEHEGSAISFVKIHFTCLAVRALNLYHSASVIAQYNTDLLVHFELECKKNSWKMTTLAVTSNTSLFNIDTRYNCFQCVSGNDAGHHPGPHHHHHRHHQTDVDTVSHCRECNEACHGWGGGHCKSPSTGSCCPYFDSNGYCTQECPHNRTGEKCSECSLTCYNGGTPDSSCTSCICPVGFTSTLCEQPITDKPTDECETEDPCLNNGICVNMLNGTSCQCPTGYTGPHCEIKDPCDPNPCNYNGICTVVNNTSYHCTCPDGLVGPTCSNIPDKCSSNDIPCYHGGICHDTDDGYYCDCNSTGYTGPTCEDNECIYNDPCQNGGTCTINPRGGYTCECMDGYSGTNCDSHEPNPTEASPLDQFVTGNEWIMGIIFGIIGLLLVILALTGLLLLYKKYNYHKYIMKTITTSTEVLNEKGMTNPLYMTPDLLASKSVQVTS